ncbi:alpha-2,8-polysialyltransferase family protein [Solitalea lacus]|uniref:alpha-2,8-polysialyltransferase family protein n=1 Tax=Solitalea lacus TaxID=2911172 RepID=UPI001EDC711D|nr:alpha-2,8-polysialyltransferase family protein [Solitalea lacus]UKJ06995.1 alpha-2,8-polysialyltransferase family protein [Solitalea lacus]
MKHVFCIHSNITFLVAQSIIKQEQIPESQCVLLLYRGFTPVDTNAVFLPEQMINIPTLNKVKKRVLSAVKNRKTIQSFLKLLNPYIQHSQFVVYTPHLDMDGIASIIDHRNCSGYFFVEEGFASYLNSSYLKPFIRKYSSQVFSKWYWKLLTLTYSYKHSRFFEIHNNYLGCYAVSDCAFQDFPKRNRINIESEEISRQVDLHNKPILVFDALLEFNLIDNMTFEHALKKMFMHVKGLGYSELYIKYHPEQYGKKSKKRLIDNLIAKYANGIDLIEVDKEVVLEQVFMSQKPIVYCMVSSLGLYASMMQCKVYSTYNKLMRKGPNRLIPLPSNLISNWTML